MRLKKREVRRQDELHFWVGRRDAFLLGYCFGPPSRRCNSFIHREDFNRRISSNLWERGKHFLPKVASCSGQLCSGVLCLLSGFLPPPPHPLAPLPLLLLDYILWLLTHASTISPNLPKRWLTLPSCLPCYTHSSLVAVGMINKRREPPLL